MEEKYNPHILIIEDSKDDFELYSRILGKIFTCEIEWHMFAESAIEPLKIKKYDLILLDYRLTSMNGLDFILKVNSMSLDLGCPVIALTGQGDENIAVKFMKLGVCDYIQKNQITFESLSSSIHNALESFHKKREVSKSREKFQVLIIENSKEDFQWYQDTLKQIFECEIDWHTSAQSAIESLRVKKYDLILLEYQLQGMNGLDCVRKIRSMNLAADCPIIVSTRHGNEDIAVEFMHLEVFEYIQKSHLSFESLLRSIYAALDAFYKKKLEKEKQADLSRFAHTIAHDLKSPLGRIAAYSKLISKKYNTMEFSYLQDIQEDVEYMTHFLNNLLLYIELGRSALEKTDIDLNKIVEQSMHNLELEIQEKNANIHVSSLPKMKGHRVALVQLFQNLIGNSIKFSRVNPVIEISAQIKNYNIIVTITDNGIGVDPQLTEEVFKPFIRVSSKNDIPGMGLGLALCKTITEQHQGTIEIIPRLEGGTKINIVFPDF